MIFRPFVQKYFKQRLYKELPFVQPAKKELDLIVCIPAYKESNLKEAIHSLLNDQLDPKQFEIHVLINYPQNASFQIKEQSKTQLELLKSLDVYAFEEELPNKHAGVGLARKILMDNAALRFESINKPGGIVLAFDGDCTCVNDHLTKVLSYFKEQPNIEAASIHFEHPLDGLSDKHKEQITDYELHLRTYINWKKQIGLPYAFQTIGSSMAVRAGAYTAKGGMNKRKAGEDFYFLHKFSTDGSFGEIKTTCVFPSARQSDRVPFGTGRAILEASELGKELNTYNPKSFLSFGLLLDQLNGLFEGKPLDTAVLDVRLLAFLESITFDLLIDECRNNSKTYQSFEKRFYKRFDAFLFMKYLHYMRDHAFPNVPSFEAANALLKLRGIEPALDGIICLEKWRVLDKT